MTIKPVANNVSIQKRMNDGYVVYAYLEGYDFVQVIHEDSSKEACRIWCDVRGYHITSHFHLITKIRQIFDKLTDGRC